MDAGLFLFTAEGIAAVILGYGVGQEFTADGVKLFGG
jgi:hypothetical protein